MIDNLPPAVNETLDLVSCIMAAEQDHLWTSMFSSVPDAVAARKKLDANLREVLQSVHAHSDQELATWLRSTHCVREQLPSWGPLLFATSEVITSRNSAADAARIIGGMLKGLNNTSVRWSTT